MIYNDFKNKLKGKWVQFSTSDGGKQFITRVKSFLWRFGIYMAVALVAYLTDKVLPTLKINPELLALIAFILGEITKFLNTEKIK